MKRGTFSKVITPAGGKRLIAKAMAARADIGEALKRGTLVILAGTTNGYVAEEILLKIGQLGGFARSRFFRGVTLPAHRPTTAMGRLPDESDFQGDVVIVKGTWVPGKTIFDIKDDLDSSAIILKGANAVNLDTQQAGVLIGHPKSGTIGIALQLLAGKRVQLILPVGLEKRVHEDITVLSRLVNRPSAVGLRLLPVSGEVFTELDALKAITGAEAALLAGGGVGGAEGSIWLAVTGTEAELKKAKKVLDEISGEPTFEAVPNES